MLGCSTGACRQGKGAKTQSKAETCSRTLSASFLGLSGLPRGLEGRRQAHQGWNGAHRAPAARAPGRRGAATLGAAARVRGHHGRGLGIPMHLVRRLRKLTRRAAVFYLHLPCTSSGGGGSAAQPGERPGAGHTQRLHPPWELFLIFVYIKKPKRILKNQLFVIKVLRGVKEKESSTEPSPMSTPSSPWLGTCPSPPGSRTGTSWWKRMGAS